MADDVTRLRTDSRSLSLSTDSPREATPPRVLKSRFVLDQKLGSGGMGTVFRAKDLRKVEAQDRFPFVAIKVLNADFQEHPQAYVALEREASRSQQLSHPNIVSIYDFDKDGDVPFMTMELLQGRELGDLLRAYPNGLPDEVLWKLIKGLCAGLSFAHEAGVVHADFKPGNVFLTSQDVAKILDFGIARAVRVTTIAEEESVFDPANLAALTPAYASLEMLNGDNPEPRDDLYSLAVVIYMAVTGHHPYGRLSAKEALAEGLKPERPKRLSNAQWRVLSRCLAFHRQNRPMSVAELEGALFKPPPWRRGGLMAIAASMVLALGVQLFIEGAEIEQVKEEVRETTLLDAQVARTAALLIEPRLDAGWRGQVATEMGRLATLDENRLHIERLQQELKTVLLGGIEASSDVAAAVALHSLGRELLDEAEFDAALVTVANRVLETSAQDFCRVQDLGAILRSGELTRMLAGVESIVAHVSSVTREANFDDVFATASLCLRQRFEQLVSANNVADAKRLQAQVAAILTSDDLAVMDQQLAEVAEKRQQLQRDAALARELAALDEQLDVSCLRLDLSALRAAVKKGDRAASFQSVALSRIDRRVADCAGRLAEVDLQGARALRLEALVSFGSLPNLLEVPLDPCVEDVQGGASVGATCRDQLKTGEGPALVVVAGQETQLAVTRDELDGDWMNAYCRSSGRCEATQAAGFPAVTDDASVVEDFAAWLTRESGYTYRLPTLEEWRLLGAAGATSRRHCAGDQLARTRSGDVDTLGLRNVLGNAAEWVKEGRGYRVARGQMDAEEGKCVVEISDEPDGAGVRLVRELS